MSLYGDVKSNIRKVIVDSLSEHPSTPVIYTHSEGTEPTSTYAALYVLSFDQVGKVTQSSRLSQDLDLTFNAGYEVTVQVTFIGKDASNICFSSYMRLANAVLNRELSQTYNLSITDKTQIRRTPQKRDTQWTDMCSFDLTFFFIGSFKQTVGVINQIVYEDPITSVEISIPPTITP